MNAVHKGFVGAESIVDEGGDRMTTRLVDRCESLTAALTVLLDYAVYDGDLSEEHIREGAIEMSAMLAYEANACAVAAGYYLDNGA